MEEATDARLSHGNIMATIREHLRDDHGGEPEGFWTEDGLHYIHSMDHLTAELDVREAE